MFLHLAEEILVGHVQPGEAVHGEVILAVEGTKVVVTGTAGIDRTEEVIVIVETDTVAIETIAHLKEIVAGIKF